MAVFTRACDHCGEPYEASRIDSRFCRDAHRAAAARAADADSAVSAPTSSAASR